MKPWPAIRERALPDTTIAGPRARALQILPVLEMLEVLTLWCWLVLGVLVVLAFDTLIYLR